MGPSDDWDPQGYEEEAEDTLAPGMHVLGEGDEDKEDDEVAEVAVIDPDAIVEEEVVEDIPAVDESGLEDLDRNPIEELDELENLVLQNERATLRLSDFSDEE